MDVIQDVTACQCAYSNLVLTIGSFDGIHLGHQKILRTVIERARSKGGAAALMSLWPHPKAFFNSGNAIPLLTDPVQKEALLRSFGLDVYFVLPFTREIAQMEPEAFLHEIILGKCGATHVVVGHDFTFGAGARGDFEFLRERGADHGLDAEMVEPVVVDGERVSSTLVRGLVNQGEMEKAQRLLGRPYAVSGVIRPGRGLGRGLGYPTANMVPNGEILPARGIYAAKVLVGQKEYLAAVSIGIAPTLPHEAPVIETHLLDFSGDLSGSRLEIQLFWRLRDEKKFDSVEALKLGIAQDITNIRHYFAHSED